MPRRIIGIRPCAALLSVLVIGGCACKPQQVEVPVPVDVPGPTKYVAIPAELLADCPARPAPARNRMTGGELLASVKAWEAWAACSDGRRAAVGALAAGPTAPVK